jgi:nitric oxide dioxygenase
MTPAQQTLVQTSFAKVAPIADLAATIFYEELFDRDPKLRALFKEDMTEQRQKLMAMLATAVGNSDEVGHAFQNEAGHLFRTEAGRCSDLKPAT